MLHDTMRRNEAVMKTSPFFPVSQDFATCLEHAACWNSCCKIMKAAKETLGSSTPLAAWLTADMQLRLVSSSISACTILLSDIGASATSNVRATQNIACAHQLELPGKRLPAWLWQRGPPSPQCLRDKELTIAQKGQHSQRKHGTVQTARLIKHNTGPADLGPWPRPNVRLNK